MFPIHLTRLAQVLALSAIVAAFAMPAVAAGANGAPPDWMERYAAAHPYGVGIEPVSNPSNWFTRNDQAHFGRSDAVVHARPVTDGRSPDTLDAAAAARQAALVPADGRSADTLDAALDPQPMVDRVAGGFDWGDAGIGAGFGGGLIALLGATGVLWLRRHPRRRMQTT